MYEIKFIQDLAIIMSLAGLVTIIFHRFKQPIVLGYMLVGVIIGPYTPPFSFISDKETIKIFSELGVIFLMFSLGLEFRLGNLLKVGPSALVAAVLEILVMIFLGYQIGKFFQWEKIDSLFLGAMLAISSTTIIVKALKDFNLSKKHFAHLIFAILIVEDIIAIVILALLTSIGSKHGITTLEAVATLGKLLLFLIVSLCIGILIVPHFLSYVAKFKRQEILLIAVLGLCFAFCLLVVKLNYSIVLGAFIIGAIIAESKNIKEIEDLIEPVKDMFSAIFFVAIGLMLDPNILTKYALPIFIITITIIVGKVTACGLGAFITGQGARTSLRVGMGLAQIGEFSFIIASLGLTLDVTSTFLFPIAVAVSALTTFFTPYLIKFSDPFASFLKKALPQPITNRLQNYTAWMQKAHINQRKSQIIIIIKRILLGIFLNLSLVIAIFISLPFIQEDLLIDTLHIQETQWSKVIVLDSALAISLPFLIAIYGKLKALTMLFTQLSMKKGNPREVMIEVIPIVFIALILLWLVKLSYVVLPSTKLLLITAMVVLVLAVLLEKWFIKVHSHLQVRLTETFKKNGDPDQKK